MYWIYLAIAGIFEIIFVVLLKMSDGMTRPVPTIGFLISSVLSFVLLTKAMQGIPVGTAYAAWTGIGAAGAMILGILLYDEPASLARLFFFMLLLIGIAGLKFTAPQGV